MTHHGLIDSTSLRTGLRYLCRSDPHIAALNRTYGTPPLWLRPPGFATLSRIILEQQVSLASAKAVYSRLVRGTGRVTPAAILHTGMRGLCGMGLTRQKASYLINLAQAVRGKDINFSELPRMSDDAVRASLQGVTGVGPWTADIFLLMALARPDIWPAGDLALLTALHRAAGWRRRRDQVQAAAYACRWSPWRSVAARMLWYSYLMERQRRQTSGRRSFPPPRLRNERAEDRRLT